VGCARHVAKDLLLRTFLSLLAGFGIGAGLGALLVYFFSPFSADELARHVAQARAASAQASQQRRAELEEQREQLRSPS